MKIPVNKATGRIMIKIIRRINKNLLIVPLFISSCAMSGCLESSFDLARESDCQNRFHSPLDLHALTYQSH